ncbi:MAG: CoA pyrophosphatase [Novosphingobium sp.]
MSSRLLSRLTALFEEGRHREITTLRDEAAFVPPGELRPAAVLIAVTERATPGMLLIHRPSHMRAHAGQAAFPGGKIDPGEDPVTAALREAHEELGIEAGDVHVIGETDRFKTRTGYHITPVLAMIPPDLPLIPNPLEVASWFEPPVDFLLDPANHIERTVEWEGMQRTFIEIDWQGHLIWGVTAAILANLGDRIGWHG